MTDQQARRRELLAAVNAGVDVGLPTPNDIRLDTERIYFDSAADLCGWADWFGYTAPILATHGQPHPNLADPFQSDEWLTNVYFEWRGDMLHLGARDPITDEQRQHWVDSGQAANFAEPADDPTGQLYSREEDPTPVSPARGGPVHTGGVVAGGELVDETPAEPVTVHFTFGVGHFDGATDLFGRYVTVVGPSWQRCRQAMVNRYGGAWCDQYGWDSPTFRQMRRCLTEHERIVVDGESTVRLVLDDVHAEALAENAEAH